MKNLIELTEIYNSCSEYNVEKQKVISRVALRNTYVNPEYIVLVRKNEKLHEKIYDENLMPDLSEGHVFSQVSIASSSQSMAVIDVLGDPKDIMDKIRTAAH